MSEELREGALEYHRQGTPGKISVTPTKPLANQRDLALAYSPGVAFACEEIVRDPIEASTLTARANLVGVVTNGTAVLGLGAIGPLASKPVMEGKGVLFKKFAAIDVFDIEINETDPDRLVDIIAALEPTFGGINLEDIKSPECFEVERRLKERMNIPVFHDDQHGTAIIVGAAVTNGLRLVGKDIRKVRLTTAGAGAAALACLDLLVSLGLPRENITVCDIKGVVYEGRTEEMDPYKARYARATDRRTLSEAVEGADIFLGLSAPGVLSGDDVKRMADKPLILALANPTPEIAPEDAKAARPDAVIATGRSDYPNQVNNVLCFPYIFRGALDVGATTINEEMKQAAVRAIAELAFAASDDTVAAAYGGEKLRFGPDYIIPKPFDNRLILSIAPAVARAAMHTGVATRPIDDFSAYRDRLSNFVFRSGLVMKPVFESARKTPQRIVYAEGEDPRVLRAVRTVVDEGLGRPVLIGRRDLIARRTKEIDLALDLESEVEVVDPQANVHYHDFANLYHTIMQRKGVSPEYARMVARTRNTLIAGLMLRRGLADAMICGTNGRYTRHLGHILDVIGLRKDVSALAAMSVLILPKGTYFLADTYVNPDPTAEEIAEITRLAADEVRRFGIEPRVALLSHSNFGSHNTDSADKMRRALTLIADQSPDLAVEGEMHADAALSAKIRNGIFPNSRISGEANLLIMPNQDAANISFNFVKMVGDGIALGPILMGPALPAHIVTPSITVRGLVNMSALASVDAHLQAETFGRPGPFRKG